MLPARERRGDGVALLARGAVGNDADRIDRLMRRAGGDEDAPSSEQPLRRRIAGEELTDGRDYLQRLGHAAGSELAAGHRACIRIHDVDTIGVQLRQIPLGSWMVPHADIHRRNRQNGFVRCEQNGGRQIISDARGHLGKDIGSGRTNHHKVGLTAELNMPDFPFFLQVEHVAIYLVFGHDAHRKRRDKLSRAFRHHRAYGNALTLQQAHKLKRFVSSDAAANDQEDAFFNHQLNPAAHMPAAPMAPATMATMK